MLGSILSNLLLVMGMCFFLGGIFNMRDARGNGSEQVFASGTAQTACSLMTLSSASLVIPATLFMVLESDKDKVAAHKSVLILSRGTAVILLLLYCLYLFFQLRTHKNLFNPEEPETTGEDDAEEEEEGDEASMSAWSAAAILILTTVVISFCADYLVDAIDPIVETGAVSKNFIGLILIPIVGNAAEHVTACVVAIKNKMDLVGSDRADAFPLRPPPSALNANTDLLMQAMGVAVGSSVQIALLVTPFLVLLGWAIDRPMDFQFETCKLPILLPRLSASFCGSCGLHYLRTSSRNGFVLYFCPRRHLRRPRRQIELPRGSYAVRSIRYHCLGFLRHPQ